MKRIGTLLPPLSALLFAALFLQGCNALNPFCGSARPAPGITSLSATSITLAQAQQGYVLTVTGTNIVSSSVIEINGNIEATQVVSSTEIQLTLNETMIPTVGAFNVAIHTPGGNSSDLACSSGGTSSAQTLTVD
jgi:hypothetical protein